MRVVLEWFPPCADACLSVACTAVVSTTVGVDMGGAGEHTNRRSGCTGRYWSPCRRRTNTLVRVGIRWWRR